jgi:hypothetical protein
MNRTDHSRLRELDYEIQALSQVGNVYSLRSRALELGHALQALTETHENTNPQYLLECKR